MSEIEKKILGIDPGTSIMGYCIIHTNKANITVITNGVLNLKHIKQHYKKLKEIYVRLNKLVTTYQPNELAIEAPFYGKNIQSMLKLGRAQGVAITIAINHNLPVYEYSPKKIKLSITGNGNASKEQVAQMLQQQLEIDKLPPYFDETDAMAAAVCHFHQTRRIRAGGSQFKDWKSYLKANPDKQA